MVTGRIVRDDFIVENVAIETLPGLRLCGNLYRPRGKRGPFPAIANPHGHWANGRLEMQPDVDRAAPPPAQPAEGRANLTAIGVNLARQGFIVFAYDMVGYNDTNQVSHKFAGSLDHWFQGVSLMGLQLWNSIRAVDYLCSLRDVDRSRIGVTGASGGGTQTFLLTAVDDRIRSSVPVNMVSAHMQGGCLCENGPALRLDTDNVEITALAAPRPLLLIAATGDWTRNNPTEEWPAIRKVYELFNAADKTRCVQFNYGHNYNIESREAMYEWFARTLTADATGDHRERPFTLDPSAMRVWNTAHPAPAGLLNEEALTQAMAARSRDALLRIWPRSTRGLDRFRETMRPALMAVFAAPETLRQPVQQPRNRQSLLLIVRSLAETPDRADALEKALRSRYTAVQRLEVPDTAVEPAEWWAKFRSCYNPTPFALACVQAAQALREAAGAYARVDVAGVGKAGPVVLFARALVPVHGSVAADPSFLLASADAQLRNMYVPCLKGLGGAGTALMLIAPSPVILPGVSVLPEGLLPDARFPSAALSIRPCGTEVAEVAEALAAAQETRRP